ncbi:TraX family protein [Butyricimonas paravirosa]|uniref:TraX family protein n=1 Tax=Butyricimonas paravirosa TaxID=1472417 RepID=UPI00242EC948|nr:TraX family protein [Butyricimonas paravirosa]
MNMTLKPAFGLSGSALKVIAMISMVIDHIALYLMEYGTVLYETMRCIGRIAFPVFAFLIAEGFIHTKSRYRYFFTLLGFAVISEIPWYLLNGADGTHNVMFTLALGVATLMVLENLLQRSMVLGFLWTLGMAGLTSWLGVDYEWRGILVIVISYLYNTYAHFFPYSRGMQFFCTFVFMMQYGVIGVVMACMIIYLYDGTRGFVQGSIAKYGFYAFYPIHLFFLSIC